MAKLHFRFSTMNAGKSTHLLQVAHNYEENGSKIALFTSALDDRNGRGTIASRIGLSREARLYSPDSNMDELLENCQGLACVLMDEAQFLTVGQVRSLHRWVHTHDTPIMCFGLRTDFRGESFPGSAALLALADSLEEIRTVCRCGKRATMQIRLDDKGNRLTQGPQVEIGGNERYQQLCARCFYSLGA